MQPINRCGKEFEQTTHDSVIDVLLQLQNHARNDEQAW